jgi:RNA polymerase sigma-70 factor, ECF subfamily
MAAAVDLKSLIDAHYESLYRYAYRLSGSAADAEDLTQETFGKVIRNLPQLREVDRVRGWLFRILRNEYLHRVRNERRNHQVAWESLGDVADEEEPLDTTPDVDPAKLQAALNELEESFRTPLILFYFEEFSYRDIAEQLDLPIGTVMSRLARAKTYLRAKLFPGKNRDGL